MSRRHTAITRTIRVVPRVAIGAIFLVVGALAASASIAAAQRGGGGGARGGGGGAPGGRGAAADTTPGFVIRDPEILDKCTRCHEADSTGHVSRLSYMRKTPEGWEMSMRRMIALNDLEIDPATARAIIKYLSDSLGLAPAEALPARFEPERRLIEFSYTGDTPTENTCKACHSIGRVMLQRRTRAEWDLLVLTHRGLYPTSERQGLGAALRGAPPPPAGAPAAAAGNGADNAVAHLSTVFPLRTPEWAAWSATMRPARLEGTWVLSGTELGRGAFYGRLTVTKGKGQDEFTTHATYRYARGGGTVTRDGSAIIFTGFQWRGRSKEPGRPATDAGMREVMMVEPGWQEMSGRWFAGGYNEIGMDVSLTRVGASPIVTGVGPRPLKTGTSQDITIFGANFPRDLQPAAIDFGPGIKVDRVVRVTPDSVSVRVTIDSAAVVGARDLYAAGAWMKSAALVYDKIGRIGISPQAGLARVGGVVFPKQLQQFEAIAYMNGPDGKPDTDDDIEIGPVSATWSVEEYVATYEDDDVKWVGAIDQNGLFTPALDGPNPKRVGSRNNIGDVWVVANYQVPGKSGPPLKARAMLIVSVPLYVRFDSWSVQQ